MEKRNTEIEILKLLEDDARISVSDIATMLDLSEKTIEKKIAKLRKDNIIRKFKTSIDWKKAGMNKAMAVVQVKVVPQERSGFARICKEISKDSRVRDLFVVTGEYDVILTIETSDMDEISKFITEKLAPKKEVVGTYTHIVLEEYKRDGVQSFDEGVKRLKVSF
ncbi:MAG: Lrp/AsnC family transcriptional regulator [Candidatus Heimdallarchaeota archaeon]|nr:Lrp/AsnC family transcriptional regulator [Candidatus Heimdallarchaeota archaeon]